MQTPYPLLDTIQTRGDLLKLDDAALKALCGEIRGFLVENLSRTGGHLASNLGVVELTVALHLALDTAGDRLVFDVGHQSYVHKLLTGRREGFINLRGFGGMSGFPRPGESVHDAFVGGHASNSLSAAAGMAHARTLAGEHYHVAALIGDGALTGGMAFEALNDVGRGDEPLIVVLNDNAMAISPCVGALAAYLSRLRLKPGYFRLKTAVQRVSGRRLEHFLRRMKQAVKAVLLPSSIFESLGFVYLGPVDGHDIPRLRQVLELAKAQTRPVLLHCTTTKGKGYLYSELRPDRYHGIVEFDARSGRSLRAKSQGFSEVFGETLCRLARDNPKICAITAAMPAGTGLLPFANEFPRRFFDAGIAEQHAVTMAAGMAKQGLTPVCAVYSTFLQRAYDQILHDIAIDGLHVVLAVDRAGLVGEDGETHQGAFDVGYLCQAPGMTVYSPASREELVTCLTRAVEEHAGPVAVRYPRGGSGRYKEDHSDAPAVLLREGSDATLVCYGIMVNQALDAADILEQEGISVSVLKILRLKPLPLDFVAAHCGRRLLIAEDCVPGGSLGQQILAGLAQMGKTPERAAHLHLGDRFVPNGSVKELLHAAGLDGPGLAAGVRALLL